MDPGLWPPPDRIVADRFFPMTDGLAWDLALDVPVAWRQVAPGEADAAWHDRLAQLSMLVHPALARCIDFGVAGGTAFEAFAVAGGTGREVQARRAALVACLHACDLTAGALGASGYSGHIVPASGTGYPLSPRVRAAERRRYAVAAHAGVGPVLGARLIERPEWQVCLECLDAAPTRGAMWVHVGGPIGAGRSTTIVYLARAARVRGWRVMGASLVLRAVRHVAGLAALVRDRHVVVLHDDPTVSVADLARALVGLLPVVGPPLVVVSTSAGEVPDAIDVALAAIPVADLRRLLIPAPNARPSTIDRHLRRAQGNPGRLLRGLGLATPRPRVGIGPTWSVRESPAGIAGGSVPFDAPPPRAAPPRRAAVRRWRSRHERACGLADRGRHAAAEHLLREALEDAAARGSRADADDAAVALAGVLMTRGRAEDVLAVSAIAEGADVRLAIARGEALVELARLVEAEAVLRTALVAADDAVAARGRVELARVRLWRGDVAGAGAALDALAPARTDDARAREFTARAIVARADGRLREAGRLATQAVEAAVAGGDAALWARLARADALVAGGQFAAALADAQEAQAIAAARHAPMARGRALVAMLRIQHGSDDVEGARASARRLRRWLAVSLPPLARLEAWRAVTLVDRDDDLARRARGVMRVAGIPAAWWEGQDPRGGGRREAGHMLDDVLRVLELCHEADDERETLTRVATLVRERTGAASAVFLVSDGPLLSTLVSAGAPWLAQQSPLAARAVASGLPMPPQPGAMGCEAAVPVRYGAAPVGVLACRWLPGDERGREPMPLLTATAAASAACVRVALDRRAPPVDPREPVPELVGVSEAIAEVRRATVRAASAPFPVLIEGESGCGKELVARAVHRLGPRRQRRMCEVNGAALIDDLLESELFGHARGAFTGAVADRPGLFEEAHGGTLFLDEVGELSARAQAKLLRAIQEGEIRRVGETSSRQVDVRLITATNRSLAAAVEAGRFRHDLLYRLDVVRITIPPLRDRAEDVPVLAQHLWARAAGRIGSRAVLASETIAALGQYAWPGNVRELQNVLAAMAVAAPPRGRVLPSALPAALARGLHGGAAETLDAARRRFEERFVRAVLARHGGHRGPVAAELGLTRQGLVKLLARLRIDEAAAHVHGRNQQGDTDEGPEDLCRTRGNRDVGPR